MEAITGFATVERLQQREVLITDIGSLLNASSDEIVEALQRRLGEIKELRAQIKGLRQVSAGARASEIAET